ncbi:hypothetical protein COLO4_13776 [Corchorus olitorius]|uniref:Uncharacterized protein n=1 Tax=Corchorus olitorius TaxID=93759 RepID=A0A1R3JV65_9ROSI|nr:hypothetical protein COLO4_13776 [Corchorus olitorius]
MAPCKKQQPPAKQTEPTPIMKMKSVANKGNLEPKKKIKKKVKIAAKTKGNKGEEKYVKTTRRRGVYRPRRQKQPAKQRKPPPEPIAAEEELEAPSEGEYRKPTEFNWDAAWQLVSGTSEPYKSPSPVSKLMNAEMRLLHIFRQIAKNKRYPPAYGNVVTEIFKESEFWNERFEQNNRRENLVPINSTSLTRMHYEQGPNNNWKKKDSDAETSTTRENSESIDSKIQKCIREMVYGPLRFLQENVQSLTEKVESLTEEVACLQRKVSGNRDAATGAENGKENEAEEDRNEGASKNPVPSLAMVIYKENAATSLRSLTKNSTSRGTKIKHTAPRFYTRAKKPKPQTSKKK